MSTSCGLTTGTVLPEHVPEELESNDQALELLNIAYADGRLLYGHSPNEWLPWAIGRIALALPIDALAFLFCDPWKSADNMCAFLFKTRDIDRIVVAIGTVLERAESHPEDIASALGESQYNAGDIRQAFIWAHPSLSPEGDDGEGPNFLFSYLKSLYSMCRSAQENDLAVVHTQWCS